MVPDEHQPVKIREYGRLSIADTGSGIEPEVLAHIFEPFFTTKPSNLGSGSDSRSCAI